MTSTGVQNRLYRERNTTHATLVTTLPSGDRLTSTILQIPCLPRLSPRRGTCQATTVNHFGMSHLWLPWYSSTGITLEVYRWPVPGPLLGGSSIGGPLQGFLWRIRQHRITHWLRVSVISSQTHKLRGCPGTPYALWLCHIAADIGYSPDNSVTSVHA